VSSTDPKAQAPALVFMIKRHSDITLAVVAALRPGFLPAFPTDERGMIGTVVSELGTNILKYAGHGTIRMQALEEDGKPGVRIEAIDQGPGIGDLEAAFRDGFSTGGTLGLGLSAVRRMMDTMNITCPVGGGTRIEATRWCRRPVRPVSPLSPPPGPRAAAPDPLPTKAMPPVRSAFSAPASFSSLSSLSPLAAAPGQPLRLQIETRNRPYRRLHVSGDRAWSRETPGYALLVHLDGTGHGTKADHAASCVIECIEQRVAQWPAQPGADAMLPLLDACHEAATGTVGAAISLVLVDRLSRHLHYVGVGNTCAMLFSPSGWEGVARAGIIGQRYSRPLVASQALRAGDSVVTFSDGLSSSAVRQLRKRSDRPTAASAIAALLMGEAKDADDASCLVATCLV
jgi:anti-sigma regulatory factor (Ser/Thr protein kinase)